MYELADRTVRAVYNRKRLQSASSSSPRRPFRREVGDPVSTPPSSPTPALLGSPALPGAWIPDSKASEASWNQSRHATSSQGSKGERAEDGTITDVKWD